MIAGVLLLVAAVLAQLITPVVRVAAERLKIVDHPGPRKIHVTVIPRLGGLAVVLAAACALVLTSWFAPADVWRAMSPGGAMAPVIAAASLVFVVGVWDDIRRAPAWAKAGVEAIAALIVIRSGVVIDHATIAGQLYELGLWTTPVTLIWILTITNAFNLIDGLDGLSAGLAVIAAATCATVLLARGFLPEATLLIAFVGALVGFLAYNFHPASIFLGDSGSLVIGFLLGVSAISGFQKSTVALAAGLPLLIFALPILDVFASVVRRLLRPGAPDSRRSVRQALASVFVADQQHIHHRLLGFGLSHRTAVLVMYGLSILLSGIALTTFRR